MTSPLLNRATGDVVLQNGVVVKYTTPATKTINFASSSSTVRGMLGADNGSAADLADTTPTVAYLYSPALVIAFTEIVYTTASSGSNIGNATRTQPTLQLVDQANSGKTATMSLRQSYLDDWPAVAIYTAATTSFTTITTLDGSGSLIVPVMAAGEASGLSTAVDYEQFGNIVRTLDLKPGDFVGVYATAVGTDFPNVTIDNPVACPLSNQFNGVFNPAAAEAGETTTPDPATCHRFYAGTAKSKAKVKINTAASGKVTVAYVVAHWK